MLLDHPVLLANIFDPSEYFPLAAFGAINTSLPSSQAALERIFSSARFQPDDRERLDADQLFEEVYVRTNARALGWNP